MSRRELLLDLRQKGKLKGLKPCFVLFRHNLGKIYNEGRGEFIMSYRNDILYFQRISSFFKRLLPKQDFTINVRRFVEYKIFRKSYMASMYLYDKDGYYLEFHYQVGTKETFSTEENIVRIIDELKKIGIKELEDCDYLEEEFDNEGTTVD
ncbi:MAG: hypothetical protein ACI35S_05965 [Anaeroplasma sp.]